MSLIILIIALVFIVSYFKFKVRYRKQLKFAAFMLQKSSLNPDDIDTMLSSCSACSDAQLYKSAYDRYDGILHDPNKKESLSQDQLERVRINMKFCEAPVFASSGPKDRRLFRYFHNFFLIRFGRRRYSFIRQDDLLEFNSFMRTHTL